MEDLYFVLCHILAALSLISAWRLLLQPNRDGNHLLAAIFMVVGVVYFIRMTTLYLGGSPSPGSSNGLLLLALFLASTYIGYPMRKLFPRLMRDWHVILDYAPFLFFMVVLYFANSVGVRFPLFDPLQTIFTLEFFRFDIIYRFILYMAIMVVSIVPTLISYTYLRNRLVLIYASFIPLFGVAVSGMFFFSDLFYLFAVLYQLVALVLILGVTYAIVVLKVSSRECVAIVEVDPEVKEALEQIPEDDNSEINSLWSSIVDYMREHEPWRDPSIKLEQLARMLNTNRTTLAQVIRENTNESFPDFIGRYRIEAFCTYVETNEIANLADAFSSVGFKSMSSAFKHFKRIHGVTPNSYISGLNQ